MYKTKKEVDAHVRTAMAKLRTDAERHLRGFTIAKLYYKICEFATAEQYLLSYLSVKEDNDQAHKQLGLCYKRLKRPDKALQSFQRSLELNSKQPELIIDVCRLFLEDNSPKNVNKAKYWCDVAEAEKVQHDVVFSLRLKLNANNLDNCQIEEIIQREIIARPSDVSLRVRLIHHYIKQNRLSDAYKYVQQLEMSHDETFMCSAEWYNVVWLVLSKYEQMSDSVKDWQFWVLIVSCLERQVYISFSLGASGGSGSHSIQKNGTGGGGVTETANLLFSLDQYLYKFSQLMNKLNGQKELIVLFLDHYQGQLLLHAASLIFRRELLQNKNRWRDTVHAVLPLLLMAYQIDTPPSSPMPWTMHCDEQGTKLVQLWQREAAFRCAQAGRTLLSCLNEDNKDNNLSSLADKDNSSNLHNMLGSKTHQHSGLWTSYDDLLSQIRQICSDKHWRRQVFSLLFCNGDQKLKEQSSLLMRSTRLAEPRYELPTCADVEKCEEDAQYLRPQSLSHMVYLCLGNENLSHIRSKYFSGMNFTTQNLVFCGAESLNQLDMDSFLYATALQAKRLLEFDRNSFDMYNWDDPKTNCKPRLLPFVNMEAQMCTNEQKNWWMIAYQTYKNPCYVSENPAEHRANLQFGIEAIRGVNGFKADMLILFHVGKLLAERGQDMDHPSAEKGALEIRAETIYRHGLNMLKMHYRGILEPFRKYFKYANASLSVVERQVTNIAEDAISYLAMRFFRRGEYEELIEQLNGVRLPFATYQQAEAYRKMDEASKTPKKSKRLYLERANECLNQTLTLLKDSQDHPLNAVIHSELQRLQQSVDNRKEFNNASGSGMGRHNNSSTYEDAEGVGYDSPAMNRSRREIVNIRENNTSNVPAFNAEMESIVKQMLSTLSFVKEELVDTIKPEMQSLRKEITSLKDKIVHLEDAMKKTRITSDPPSRDDDPAHVLDELYIFDESLQNQLYQQQQQQHHHQQQHFLQSGGTSTSGPGSMFPGTAGYPQLPPGATFGQQQPQQIHNTPNAALQQLQQNAVVAAVAAYNTPTFPNSPFTYYTPTSYMPYIQPPPPVASNVASGHLPAVPAASLQQPQQQQQQHGLFMQQQQSQHLQLNTANININGQTTPGISYFNKAANNQPVEKGPPANVVITSSDPLPNPNIATVAQSQQPTLSVTIPSHHLKGSLIQTPDIPVTSSASSMNFTFGSNSNPAAVSLFSGSGVNKIGESLTTIKSAPNIIAPTPPSTTISPATVNTSTFSFKPQVMQALQQQQQQLQQAPSLFAAPFTFGSSDTTTDNTPVTHNESANSLDLNKNGDGSDEAEYDPRPDFKAIIPLPDEVDVITGEEDEKVMFCRQAKLFRHLDDEWKERGAGDLKILLNKNGQSRILMRRNQTHKVCANHIISKELILTVPKKETKGFIWVANDYADEKVQKEKFFVRFKLPEAAPEFQEAFKKAQQEHVNATIVSESANSNEHTTTAITKNTIAPLKFGQSKNGSLNFATSTPSTKSNIVGATTHSNTIDSPASANTLITTNTVDVSKTLFGGIDGGIGTIAKPIAGDEKQTASSTTNSPFSNFVFSTTSFSTAPAAVATINTVTSNSNLKTSSSPFANIFGTLNKTTESPFNKNNLPQFQSTTACTTTTTTPITTTPSATTLNKSNVSDTEDDYVPTAQFQPVITLPDLVEVTTGEENETILFEHRAKLLRYDQEHAEWKERGLGNIKLLQSNDDPNRVRLLMRREQVHKLCCNQRVYRETTFNYAKNTQTAVTWAGQDFSEEELVTEMLTVRFKFAETCKQFLDAIHAAQARMVVDNINGVSAKDNGVELKDPTAPTKGFGDKFKPKVGSWNCDGCYVTNAADKLYCSACEAPKDSTVPKANTSLSLACQNFKLADTGAPKFSFGFGAATTTTTTPTILAAKEAPTTKANIGFGDEFKPKEGSWSCSACYVSNKTTDLLCLACNTPKDNSIANKQDAPGGVLSLTNVGPSKFNFGFAATGATASTVTNGGSFNFNNPLEATTAFQTAVSPFSDGKTISTSLPSVGENVGSLGKATFNFKLASKAMEKPSKPSAGGGEATEDLGFSMEKKEFNFILPTGVSNSPRPLSETSGLTPGQGARSPMKFDGAGGDGDDEQYQEEEENNTYFTPVIPLPDKIDVKTGEENESVLYVHRAKLYRFHEGEWKERGVGDLKILRHKETEKLRVVMRRDQVLKICLNHVLNEDVDYKRKDDKSWLFVVNDFSEGAVEMEKFSLRFKNSEIAENFHQAVQAALVNNESINNSIEEKSDKTSPNLSLAEKSCSNTAKHNIISEPDQNSANQLIISSKCSGCRGCDPDAFTFPEQDVEPLSFVWEYQHDGELELLPLELPSLTRSVKKVNAIGAAPTSSLLKQSALQASAESTTLTTVENNSPAATAKTITTVPSMSNPFSGGSDNTSTFSFVSAFNSTAKPGEDYASSVNNSGSGGFLFGNTFGSGGKIFGDTGKTKFGAFGQKPSIFGGGNIAAANGDKDNASGSSIFNSGGTAGSFSLKSTFPSTTVDNNTTSKPSFGGTAIFGGGASNIFGGATFGSTTTTNNGGNTQTTLFGGIDASSNKNNNTTVPASTFSFGDLSGGIDFASLAANATSTNTSSSEKTGSGFIGLKNTTDAFSGTTNSFDNNNKSKDGQDVNEGEDNYDPHYEPIIALPEEIVVSTGEENETKLFGMRATLFRFDDVNKEWKERGVGEMKILMHQTKHTSRLVMRREQIHKLVLNHAVTADFVFTNMNNNPKSFMWAAMNFAEKTDGEVEKLAVRFKKVEIAEEFSKKLNECIETAKKKQNEQQKT